MARSPSPHLQQSRKKRRDRLLNNIPTSSLQIPGMSTSSIQISIPSTGGDASSDQHEANLHLHYNLLDLPSEILLQIAAELCGTKAIVELSLVNKQCRGIAREAFVKKLVVPRNSIKQVIQMLTRRPEDLSKVQSIDLGAYMSRHSQQCLCLADTTFDHNVRTVLRNRVSLNTGGEITWNQLQRAKNDRNEVWSSRHQFFMDILVSLCTNIKSISIEMPYAPGFDRSPMSRFVPVSNSTRIIPNPQFVPVTPFQGATLQVLQSKLQALTILHSSNWIGPMKRELLVDPSDIRWRHIGKHIITLRGFNKLRYLDVPMDTLGIPQSILFAERKEERPFKITASLHNYTKSVTGKTVELEAKFLPPSLTTLRLRSCNKRAFRLLKVIEKTDTEVLRLKRIDLYLDTCARSAILLCYRADCGHWDYSSLLSVLQTKGINVTFFTGSDQKPIDIKGELEVFYQLSPSEVGMVATAGKQFSNLSMSAIKRRRSSSLERKFFMRHALGYWGLLNSPSFDVNVWSDVAFFHGNQNTASDPIFVSREGRVRNDFSFFEKPRRRTQVGMDLSNFVFSFSSHTPTSMPIDLVASVPRIFLGNIAASMAEKLARSIHDTGRRLAKRMNLDENSNIMDADTNLVVGDRKAEKTKHDPKKIPARTSEINLLPIYFNGMEDSSKGIRAHTLGFDADLWRDVDWVSFIQPRLIATLSAH